MRGRDFAIDALQSLRPSAVRRPRTGEVGGQHRDGVHLRDSQPSPTGVTTELIATGELIDLKDVGATHVTTIDARFDDTEVPTVIHLDEVMTLDRFIYRQVHG